MMYTYFILHTNSRRTVNVRWKVVKLSRIGLTLFMPGSLASSVTVLIDFLISFAVTIQQYVVVICLILPDRRALLPVVGRLVVLVGPTTSCWTWLTSLALHSALNFFTRYVHGHSDVKLPTSWRRQNDVTSLTSWRRRTRRWRWSRYTWGRWLTWAPSLPAASWCDESDLACP